MPSPETPPPDDRYMLDAGYLDRIGVNTSTGETRSSRWFRFWQFAYRFLGLSWRTAPARNGGRYSDLP